MGSPVKRRTVDLSGYPDLVVIYLGMRVNAWYGLKTLIGFGAHRESGGGRATGLLLHEPIVYSLFPPNVGMRQYWNDFDSLERWTRSEPHAAWWREFLRNSGGTGFWHQTYFMRWGMEAIYDDLPRPIGLQKFAPEVVARGPMFGARKRAGRAGESAGPAPVEEGSLEGHS